MDGMSIDFTTHKRIVICQLFVYFLSHPNLILLLARKPKKCYI